MSNKIYDRNSTIDFWDGVDNLIVGIKKITLTGVITLKTGWKR